jgi:hypothetical protein
LLTLKSFNKYLTTLFDKKEQHGSAGTKLLNAPPGLKPTLNFIVVKNMRKAIIVLLTMGLSVPSFAQKHTALAHGTVFGSKPNAVAVVTAVHLENYMAKKARISTTISGTVTKVIKTKGGWFDIDAGNGKVIAAHFREYHITIPENLKGKYIIAEGVAEKQFTADDMQHLAGGDKQHGVKVNPKQRLTFEVSGLMVER